MIMNVFKHSRIHFGCFLLCCLLLCSGLQLQSKEKRVLTFQDVMKFKQIKNTQISDNGAWLIYAAVPDRGNPEVKVVSTGDKKIFVIERGSKPAITTDGKWAAAILNPDVSAAEKKGKKKKKTGMILLNTANGKTTNFNRVKGFVFSKDSRWLAIQLLPGEKKAGKKEEGKKSNDKKGEKKQKEKHGDLLLIHLTSGHKQRVARVSSFAVDPVSRYLVFVKESEDKKKRSLVMKRLIKDVEESQILHQDDNSSYFHLTWSKKSSLLAFLSQRMEEKDKSRVPPGCQLWIWSGKTKKLFSAIHGKNQPAGWLLPSQNTLRWTEDEERLFFGLKPQDEYQMFYRKEKSKEKTAEKQDPFDMGKILSKKGVDVWHWQDPFIIPQQKKQWNRFKKKTYPAVFWLKLKHLVQLGDNQITDSRPAENPYFMLANSGIPYFREITWDGWYQDIYLINIKNGLRKKILTRHQHDVHLSPNGKFVAYYKEKHWYLLNTRTLATKCLTDSLSVPFYDEDHDYPAVVPGYGLVGWLAKDKGVLINDKYDIWQFSTATGKGFTITAGEGRKKRLTFRIRKLDKEMRFFRNKQNVLMTTFAHDNKYTHIYGARIGESGSFPLATGNKKYSLVRKAKDADVLLYTRQDFREFPDIWWADPEFKTRMKLSNENLQIKDFLWGDAQLIGWQSMDGIPLRGVVIKPENFVAGRRYPVLVYYYRFFSQRLFEFNQVVVNHRPCFPFYTSNGYVVFLPDIRFEVGQPGFAASKCLVPGVQKLIDMGIADPKAVALHGHSWSGYQTAFVITQTNIFAAAIAGAPVSNMTSAYSGIRWGSGLARQFQYEKSQSRIGGTLWDSRQKYIDNSPVFFADRIKTPLLIQFGDKDGAVPWYQGIELYLAMRRLDKECIFLQYRNEPHHLKQYANKLDYSIKMKQYLDHYLKGKPAADWIKEGVRYKKN